MAEGAEKTAIDFGGGTPILRVEDLDKSLAYYTGPLGFRVDFRHLTMFASVSRGRCTVFLCAGDQGHRGTWLWVGVSDVTRLFEELRANGAIVRQPPTNHPWALEIQILDLDGNVLRFGSDPLEGQPLGEWMDMEGNLWPPSGTDAAPPVDCP